MRLLLIVFAVFSNVCAQTLPALSVEVGKALNPTGYAGNFQPSVCSSYSWQNNQDPTIGTGIIFDANTGFFSSTKVLGTAKTVTATLICTTNTGAQDPRSLTIKIYTVPTYSGATTAFSSDYNAPALKLSLNSLFQDVSGSALTFAFKNANEGQLLQARGFSLNSVGWEITGNALPAATDVNPP